MSKDDIVNTKLPSYEVQSATLERVLKEYARKLKADLPPNVGFTLFIFDYTKDDENPGNLFYLSSAERSTMLKVIREFLKKQEQPPHAR